MIFNEFDNLVEQKKREKSKSNTRGKDNRSHSQSRQRNPGDELEGTNKKIRDTSQDTSGIKGIGGDFEGSGAAGGNFRKNRRNKVNQTTRRNRVREN